MRILVTGGAGFIGSHLVDQLIKQKHQVFVIDDLSTGKKSNINQKAVFYKTKIQGKNIENIFRKHRFNLIFHLAAQKNLQYSKDFPTKDAEINIIGSLNILSNAIKYNVKKIIFYSTAAVYHPESKPPNKETDYPRPVTPYGIGKYAFENYLVNSGLNYSILRLSNVYGPRQDSSGEGGVVSIFCKNLINNKRSKIFNTGHQTRDYIHVDDVVNASIKTITKGHNKILNVSIGKEISVNNLYLELSKIANSKLKTILGEKLSEQFRSSLSNIRAKKYLNWHPKINISNGLRSTYNWFKRQL